MDKLLKLLGLVDKNADRVGYWDGLYKLIRDGTIFGVAFGVPNFAIFDDLGMPEKVVLGCFAALLTFPITSLILYAHKSLTNKWEKSSKADYDVRFDTYIADAKRYPARTVEVTAKIKFNKSVSEFHCNMKAGNINTKDNGWIWRWTTTEDLVSRRSFKSGAEISFPILISQKGQDAPLWGKELDKEFNYLQHAFELTLVSLRLMIETNKSLDEHDFSVMLGREVIEEESQNNRTIRKVVMSGTRAHCDRQWIERQDGWLD